jgi:spore coat polysaccharide biosynthesis protein SpsF
VRITSDCPLIDPELIDDVIRAFLLQKPDYASNSLVETYPRGLDVEVFSAQVLAYAWRSAKEAYQRTHVTPYLYEEPGRFQVLSLTADGDYGKYLWTLDTEEDLELIQAIYAHFGQSDKIGWREILRLMEDQPELAGLNSQVRQKALHEG